MDQRYKTLTLKINMGDSERIARLFSMIADELDADMMLAMPAQAPELAEKFNLDESRVQERLDELFLKGLVFKNKRTNPISYRMVRDFFQFHDATILWPEATQEFFDLWVEYMDEEWPEFAKQVEQVMPKPGMRVIPVNISVPAKQAVLSFEDIKELIDEANVLAVTACTCRLTMKRWDREVYNCIQLNNGALYALERGTGREVTKQEAIDICKQAEEQGLIHSAFNTTKPGHVICNCCPCCCENLDILLKYNTKFVDPSRFKAEIDQDECTACGVCHDACHFGAIGWTGDEGSESVVDPDKCLGCGVCLVQCPTEAISLIEVRPKDFIPGAA